MKEKLVSFAKGMMLSVGEICPLNWPVLNSVTCLAAAELGHITSSLDGAIQKLLHPAQDMIRIGYGSLKAAAHRKVIQVLSQVKLHWLHFEMLSFHVHL